MTAKRNYYELLRIPNDADYKTILRALNHYREKDIAGKYKSLLATIEHTLTNPDRRRAYDRLIAQDTPLPKYSKKISTTSGGNLTDNDAKHNPSVKAAPADKPQIKLAEESPTNASKFQQENPKQTPNFDEHLQASSRGGRAQATTNTQPHKDRFSATWLAYFGGVFGLHRFWLGQWYFGITYIVVSLLTGGLAALFALIEAIIFLTSSNESWQRKHGDKLSSYPGKDKHAAGMLAIFAGLFGAHRFYLGQWKLALVYVLFFWTFIPWLVAIIEGFIILSKDDKQWNAQYGDIPNNARGCLMAILAPMIVFFTLGILAAITLPAYQDYIERAEQHRVSIERQVQQEP